VVLAKGCAVCLVLLVLSPVTAPFRTLDGLTSCARSRAALSVPLGSDASSIDDATLTTDPVLAKSIRFGSVIPLGAVSSVFGLPLADASSPLARPARAPARCSHVSPVLRV
jgi:hypothetical protein